MEKAHQKIFRLMLVIFVLIILNILVVYVKKNQEGRKEAINNSMPKVGYPCDGICKPEYCHLLNLKWDKGDCPNKTPYCCR